MGFEKIFICPVDADGNIITDEKSWELVIKYCAALRAVPPPTEYYLGDPEYDWSTLNSSAGARDAFVRAKTKDYDGIEVKWDPPELHELSTNGKMWVTSTGRGLRYPLTQAKKSDVYLSVRFGVVP